MPNGQTQRSFTIFPLFDGNGYDVLQAFSAVRHTRKRLVKRVRMSTPQNLVFIEIIDGLLIRLIIDNGSQSEFTVSNPP